MMDALSILGRAVFGVSNKLIFKPACSATDTSQKIENLLILDMVLSNIRKANALIRLCGCAGYSLHLCCSQTAEGRFSGVGPLLM